MKKILFFLIFLLLGSNCLAYDIVGKYKCAEKEINYKNIKLKSDLFISKVKDQYLFIWYYKNGDIFEGKSIKQTEETFPSSSILVEFFDKNIINPEANTGTGYEKIYIRSNGDVIEGYFNFYKKSRGIELHPNKFDGHEVCKIVYRNIIPDSTSKN